MNGDQPVIPKITLHRPAPNYHRTDLYNLLDELSSRQLIVVSGPPGTGKSTLIATYIESRKLSSVWYRVDKADNDLATFYYYLGIAACEAKSHDKPAMPHLTPGISEGNIAFAKRYFRELYRHLEFPFLIVFDNYQDVAGDAALHEAIRVACTELPQGGRIVIISRKECPPAMARLRASNRVAIIEADDLQLSPGEVMPSPACTA